MRKTRLVYVSYIRSTAERVWDALVKPEVTAAYWGRHHNVSDWTPGSRWAHQDADDPALVDIVGTVVEATPPHRLVVTWSYPKDAEDRSKHSRVTFEIAPAEGSVRLTVTHDELEEDSDMCRGVSNGWPIVLSSLKSLLETGEALPGTACRWKK